MAFKEYMIKRELSPLDRIATLLLYAAAAAVSLVVIVLFLPTQLASISLLAVFGLFWLAHYLSARLRREYEYICTDDCIDIDMIMNKSRRKRLISFDMKNTELLASVGDPDYANVLTSQFDKTIDATSGRRDAQVYFAVVDKNGRTLVKFEPTYNMLTSLQQYARSKVHIHE